MTSTASTAKFIEDDFKSSLFPLKTNFIMAQNHGTEIANYIYQKILNPECEGDNFLSQQRVYATKSKGHLRRTVKLDPVAEYFMYDLVFRNRSIFRPQVSDTRRSFGYRFQNGSLIPVSKAYVEYKLHLNECASKYKHNIQFDIASYFNSLYHHDLSHWFSSKDVSQIDKDAIGKFLREINTGRSVDFLPHGIYPCKMIGNEFLKVVDLSGTLKSAQIARFMDDFILFDDNPNILTQDFIKIQHLLGKFALNVNPSKTLYDYEPLHLELKLSGINESLKQIVFDYVEVNTPSGVDLIEVESESKTPLSKEQVKELMLILKDDNLGESEAELLLKFLCTHSESESLLKSIPILLGRFPNIIKQIYSICASITDKKGLSIAISNYLNNDSCFLEYHLFWTASLLEDYLQGEELYGESLMKIFEISSSSDFKIAKAKILEIPEQGFGFKEIRDDYLKTGQSDWLSWASAMGTRTLNVAERNYVLDYFSKGSPMNFLIASCVKKLNLVA